MYEKYKYHRKRQAGRIYEFFIAETLRREGWIVFENGRSGVNDHGIDLIASKDGVTRYIQCKGWKRTWLIHSDVVSQLFGSVAGIEGKDGLGGVELYLYSPAQLDSYAAAEAERLDIHFVQLPYPHWRHRVKHYLRRFRHQAYTPSKPY